MAGAEKGITFSNQNGNYKASLSILSTTQNAPAWRQEGDFNLSKISRVLSAYDDTDLRFTAGFEKSILLSNHHIVFKLLAEFTDSINSHIYFKPGADIGLPNGSAPLESTDGTFICTNLDGGGHTVTYTIKDNAYADMGGGLFFGWQGSCSHLTIAGTMDVTVNGS